MHQAETQAVQDVFVDIQSLQKIYHTREGDRIEALTDVSLSLKSGEFVAVVGPSGCGKTTLLKILAGLLPYTDGTISLSGRPIHGPQRDMGVVFQSPTLLPWLTVLQNVQLPLKILKLDLRQYEKHSRTLLELVGLAGFEGKYPSELSGGMQQRVAIVRGLIHDPGMLLMDEPFGALDALTRDRMGIELQRIWLANRKTVFFITHSIPEAVFLADRVIVMSPRPGRIVKEIAVPFPRPRRLDVMATQEFGEMAIEIRRLLGVMSDE